MDRLTIEASPFIGAKVTVAGIEIASKEDWDKVLQKLEDTLRENERLKEENELFRKGFGLAQTIKYLQKSR